MNIVMVAAENGAIAGGKVGGMGDVLRDLPNALARLGHGVDVIVPGYQAFFRLPGATLHGSVSVSFRGSVEKAKVFSLVLPHAHSEVRCWILDHPLLAPGKPGEIYCNDPPDRPFATDASKFAFFCAAVCEWLISDQMGDVDVIHLHDWHTAPVALLARYQPRFATLGEKRLVLTIHNLALQGIRPFAGDNSALESWFPDLRYDKDVVGDPRYPDCLNPLRTAINLCDRVHTVSATYAAEIQRPSEPDAGFFGGEGLQDDLRRAHEQKRLVGILNGCEYDAAAPPPAGGFGDLLQLAEQQIVEWIGAQATVASPHCLALRRVGLLKKRRKRPGTVLTSVGRLTNQKVLLLRQPMANGKSGMENLLAALGESDLLIMLGSGDPELEQFFTALAAGNDNFLFLRGYAETLSEQLYRQGDLFLMPSSFEPGGISQMLAMRAGQPCLVHGVGGLKDTVEHNVDGFVFRGEDLLQQGEAMVNTLREALTLKRGSPQTWREISKRAAKRRFLWRDTAERYCAELYNY